MFSDNTYVDSFHKHGLNMLLLTPFISQMGNSPHSEYYILDLPCPSVCHGFSPWTSDIFIPCSTERAGLAVIDNPEPASLSFRSSVEMCSSFFTFSFWGPLENEELIQGKQRSNELMPDT